MSILAPAFDQKEIRLHTGVRLRYADLGSRDGQPLIFLHGFSDSGLSFASILEFLPPDLRLIIPDQRGHGHSGRPLDGYTPTDLAMDAIALLDELEVRSAVAVGHSLGSFVAQRMAALAPTRVNTLILEGSAAKRHNSKLTELERAIKSMGDTIEIEFIREFQASSVHRPVPALLMDQAVRESLKLPAAVWRSVIEGLINPPFLAEAEEIHCPTNVFWGDQDSVFDRSDQDDLLRCIPGAALHVFHNVGHTPHWEVPVDFANELMIRLRL